jgi:hypothetical protein
MFQVNGTAWSRGLVVTGGGTGVVSHAGSVLLRRLSDQVGLTAGLSQALASPRLVVHDRGVVLADLACAIAGGAESMSDFRVLGDQQGLLGQVASVPTLWRALRETADGGDKTARKVRKAVARARKRAWAAIGDRNGGGLPGVRVAGKVLGGVTCIRLDATVVPAHSDKEGAEPNFKGFGHHPLLAYCDNTSEPLGGELRPGSAGSNTAADHVRLTDEALAAVPDRFRRNVMITCDGAGASHDLVSHLDKLASRPGRVLTWSVGWEAGEREKAAIGEVAPRAWQIAIDAGGEVRERRSGDACGNRDCGHRKCWIQEAQVAELTGIMRGGREDSLAKAKWPASMRVFARRERAHPGAQLSLFEEERGWRYSLWATNLPDKTKGWRGQLAYIDAAHRVHARVEDGIRTGKDCGYGKLPSSDLGINKAWLAAALIAATLLAWLRLIALDGDLARAEPKTLRYRILHAAARLTRGGRQRHLRIAAGWPWAQDIITGWQRIQALPSPG